MLSKSPHLKRLFANHNSNRLSESARGFKDGEDDQNERQ